MEVRKEDGKKEKRERGAEVNGDKEKGLRGELGEGKQGKLRQKQCEGNGKR